MFRSLQAKSQMHTKMKQFLLTAILFSAVFGSENRINIELEDGKTWKWGMYISYVKSSPWKKRIAFMEDGQAREKGLQEGWKIKSIDGEEITEENHNKFDSILKEETPCTMIFEKPELNNLHKALIEEKSAEEIKETIQEWVNKKGKDWLTEKIIEEIDSIQWMCKLILSNEEVQRSFKDIKIFEGILNFLEKKPNELKEYIIKNESFYMLYDLIYEDDSKARLELLLKTLKKQGENVEDYLCSVEFPLVHVLRSNKEEHIDFIIQNISPQKLIYRIFKDSENLLKKFTRHSPIAFKKLVQIALDIGEQNALIKQIEREIDMTLGWFTKYEQCEEIYEIIIEKIYKGKENEFIKYLQKNNSSAIFHAFVTENVSAIKIYINTIKNYGSTEILINELISTKKYGSWSPLMISALKPNLLQLIEEIIPEERFKEMLFDPNYLNQINKK
jgi:hypothetical protein